MKKRKQRIVTYEQLVQMAVEQQQRLARTRRKMPVFDVSKWEPMARGRSRDNYYAASDAMRDGDYTDCYDGSD
jgi:hypothetical protein